ncbi:PAS domain S-box-containing protein [Desulfacinum infernum DSM 9756]|uniref:histidine kinase n=1 Tax=Desulfacinum infernum DSM 9756 TaxID=1121391 RepID=A0A1M5CVK3_9BACT|nr:ATP-binding protein [Desulfacinum infernum]SHF58748.1 PAS domain S-box-containing protein [Desulfacinum infernum DSM 9756]
MLKIGIIGGGRRCERILSLLEEGRLRHLQAEVVAVADINPEAPGYVRARQRGIYTTTNYMDFFDLPQLDLVIELTGNEALLHDLLRHKPPDLRVLDLAMSRICEDLVCFEAELENRERRIQFTERYLKQLLQVVRDPIMVLSPDRTIVDANDALFDSVGMSRAEVIGKRCHEVSHRSPEPCRGPHHACPLDDALSLRTSAHTIHEHHTSETRTRYYDVLAYPLTDERGEVVLVLEIWRDISTALERQVEEKTRQIKEDLARLVHEDKMIALGKLVASAVHEINNPLAAIHTFAKVMLRMVKRAQGSMGPEDLAEMEKFLEMVAGESKRCGDIVTNLLSFSRHQPLVRRPVQINDVTKRIVILLQHKMELQKIRLHLEPADDLPTIPGDLNQIQQTLMNLVFNAMEAMPEGDDLWIRTRFQADSGQVAVEVEDTGCGIPEEHLQKIFEPFFSTKSHDKGVGLGLAVVYGIIKEHRGEIEVESRVGKGTLFRVLFPAAGR